MIEASHRCLVVLVTWIIRYDCEDDYHVNQDIETGGSNCAAEHQVDRNNWLFGNISFYPDKEAESCNRTEQCRNNDGVAPGEATSSWIQLEEQ
jgi:hypothetical protein